METKAFFMSLPWIVCTAELGFEAFVIVETKLGLSISAAL
jgi:hypothetical protein